MPSNVRSLKVIVAAALIVTWLFPSSIAAAVLSGSGQECSQDVSPYGEVPCAASKPDGEYWTSPKVHVSNSAIARIELQSTDVAAGSRYLVSENELSWDIGRPQGSVNEPASLAGAHELSGKVYYSSAPKSGAFVTLKQDSLVIASTTTDATGDYAFGGVPDGTYVLEWGVKGDSSFLTLSQGGHIVTSDLSVNLHLEKVLTINGNSFGAHTTVDTLHPTFCSSYLAEADIYGFTTQLHGDYSVVEFHSSRETCYTVVSTLQDHTEYSVIAYLKDEYGTR